MDFVSIRIDMVSSYSVHIYTVIIRIKHGFSCINIRQVPWEVLKTKAEGIEKPSSIAIIA